MKLILQASLIPFAAIAIACIGLSCSSRRPSDAGSSLPVTAQTLPRGWIDPDTGHRIIRLTDEDNSESAYFHYNWFSADGKKVIFLGPRDICSVDLGSLKNEHLYPGRLIECGRVSNEIFYTHEPQVRDSLQRVAGLRAATDPSNPELARNGFSALDATPEDNAIYAMDIDSHAERKVVTLPRGYRVTCMNADQSLFAGVITGDRAIDPSGVVKRPAAREVIDQRERMFPGKAELSPLERLAVQKENALSRRLSNPGPMALFTINARTGQVNTFGYSYAWLNHLQFSPVDPTLMMFAHEGTWHEVERIWTIRTDGTGLRLMHTRSMPMEIAGHEFWGHDGKTLWFDLQTPRSQNFWIGGANVESGLEVRYQVDRNWWSVHYNVSRDGSLFCGDGGDPGQVAYAPDGQWIDLFRRNADGTLKREKLVNMSKHDYALEPNAIFTPDGKWITFRSNMLGPKHVFAVEIGGGK